MGIAHAPGAWLSGYCGGGFVGCVSAGGVSDAGGVVESAGGGVVVSAGGVSAGGGDEGVAVVVLSLGGVSFLLHAAIIASAAHRGTRSFVFMESSRTWGGGAHLTP